LKTSQNSRFPIRAFGTAISCNRRLIGEVEIKKKEYIQEEWEWDWASPIIRERVPDPDAMMGLSTEPAIRPLIPRSTM
jgi:hypothetical protein